MQIDFTFDQIGVLDRAIQQLPYYVAAPLVAHINKQIEEQRKAMETPVDLDGVVCPKTHQQNGE